jgi:hypothetical protein
VSGCGGSNWGARPPGSVSCPPAPGLLRTSSPHGRDKTHPLHARADPRPRPLLAPPPSQISKLLALPAAAGALLAAGNAQAATELAQLAATSDARLATIALLFVPAIGWVGFNMLGPLNNQLARMSENNAAPAPKAKAAKRRGVAGAVGLGAALSLAAAQQAEAASEVAQLAATDNR